MRRAPSSCRAIRVAMCGRAASSRARCAGVKPCRPPSGSPAGQSRPTRRTPAPPPGAVGVSAEPGPRSVRSEPAPSEPAPSDTVPVAGAGARAASASCAATSSWPRARTSAGSCTPPAASATRSTRAPSSAANFSRWLRSASERMSTRATTTYRSRGKCACSAVIVFRTVRPVENSSSTSTSGPSPARSARSSGSSRCEVAWLCSSSNPPTCATPATGRRVECRYGASARPSATECPRPVAVSA